MYRTNAKIKSYLIQQGYKDIHLFPHTHWIKDVHFQGEEFDGLASKGTKLVLFQCKSNCKASKKILQQYREISKRFNILCLWINSVDRKGIEVNNVIRNKEKMKIEALKQELGVSEDYG